jgi:hypothetical protein
MAAEVLELDMQAPTLVDALRNSHSPYRRAA